MGLSSKDIIVFGKVLCEIGSLLQTSPDILLNLLSTSTDMQKENIEDDPLTFEGIRNSQEIGEYLESYSLEQLKRFVKENHFGVPAKPSKVKLIECIIRNVNKEQKDVFINYQTATEKKIEVNKQFEI